EAIDVSGSEIIKNLMGRGVMANMNQTLEADVAGDVAAAFGVLLEIGKEEEGAELLGEVDAGDDADLEPR
ncbi:MAG: hypothetical protein GWN29_13880, partial [Gammaproteobacteria bacterium]|nr:hypothetical protein [Gammaproteobacteria bacterium]